WASLLVRMPVMRWRVVCALRETMLIFSPTSRLSSVDLPTLGRPTMAIYPERIFFMPALPSRLFRQRPVRQSGDWRRDQWYVAVDCLFRKPPQSAAHGQHRRLQATDSAEAASFALAAIPAGWFWDPSGPARA